MAAQPPQPRRRQLGRQAPGRSAEWTDLSYRRERSCTQAQKGCRAPARRFQCHSVADVWALAECCSMRGKERTEKAYV